MLSPAIPEGISSVVMHVAIPNVICGSSGDRQGNEQLLLTILLRRSLPYEVQNHVRPNFATTMLYAKNHSKFYKVFCTIIKPLELYFVNF